MGSTRVIEPVASICRHRLTEASRTRPAFLAKLGEVGEFDANAMVFDEMAPSLMNRSRSG